MFCLFKYSFCSNFNSLKSSNGILSGTTTAGSYNFYVNVIDSENQIITQQVTLNIITSASINYLLIAGGGAGGLVLGGGGGAGGFLESS